MRQLYPKKNETVVYGIFTPSLNKGFPIQKESNPTNEKGFFEIISNNVIFSGVVPTSDLEKHNYVDVVVDTNFKDRTVRKESYQSFQRKQKNNAFARRDTVQARPKKLRLRCLRQFLFTDKEELEETVSFHMGVAFNGQTDDYVADEITTLVELVDYFHPVVHEAYSVVSHTGFSISRIHSPELLAGFANKHSLSVIFSEPSEEIKELFGKEAKEYNEQQFLSSWGSLGPIGRGSGKSGIITSAVKQMVNSIYGSVGIPSTMLQQPIVTAVQKPTLPSPMPTLSTNFKGLYPGMIGNIHTGIVVDEASMTTTDLSCNLGLPPLSGDFEGDTLNIVEAEEE